MKIGYCFSTFVVTVCLAFAQDTATTPIKIAKKESVKIIKGVVVSRDTLAKTVVIQSWQAEDTLVVNSNTSITAGLELSINFADINADDKATAYYKIKEGNKVALRIIKIVTTPE